MRTRYLHGTPTGFSVQEPVGAPMEDQKRCGNCGYLALRINGTGEMGEAPKTYRQEGQFDPQRTGASPHCAKFHLNLPTLASETARRLSNDRDANPARLDALLELLNKPQDNCPFWTEYFPLHTPKEHDQIVWQKLAFDVQKQIAELQRDALQRQVQQSERDAKLVERLQAVEHRRHWEVIIAAVVAAILGAVLTGAFTVWAATAVRGAGG